MALSPSRPAPVLVLRALGLGDALTAVPALRALRRRFAGRPLLLAAAGPPADLVLRYGLVDAVTGTAGLDDVPPGRGLGPHLAVNLHGSGPRSHRLLLAGRPQALIAFDRPDVGHRGPAWDPAEHEVRRWCRLVGSSDAPADPADLRLPPDVRPGAARSGPVVIHPGAASGSRRWPPDRFAAVAAAFAGRGTTVVVTGTAAEQALCRTVVDRAGLPATAGLAGRLALPELATLVARAALLICGDTGIAHLATALGTPSVLLFGPTPPDRWGPLVDPELHRVLWPGRPLDPPGDPHADEPDPVLLRIGVTDVLTAAAALHPVPPVPHEAPGARHVGVHPGDGGADPRVGVVMITHNRREEALDAVERCLALPERPRVVVVDNGSSDGTPAAIRHRHPRAELISCPDNLGGVGRNVGAARLGTPYVAFCDDDTWWEPGALSTAADALDEHPDVAVLTARILVEPGSREDPIVAELRDSPVLGRPGLPGPAIGSFLAGASVVRRDAFLACGGFDARLWLGGEEELLAVDLSTAGWELCYLEQLTVHHRASRLRDPGARRRVGLRNTLWFTWLRRPVRPALRRTLHLAATVPHDRTSLLAALDAARGARWVAAARRPVPPRVEARLAALDGPQRHSRARRYVG